MAFFDPVAYQAELDKATSIADCPKVPCPTEVTDRNYIFISYAHEDFRQVYPILAHLYAHGVRFWYDRKLTAGVNWETEAKERIRHPHCSGVVFFLSENLFLSKSVIETELPCVLGVDAKGNPIDGQEQLNYFCVNLTDHRPSDVLFDVMPEMRLRGQGSSWLRLLSTAFPDENTYVSAKEKGYCDTLVQQIRDTFNVVEDVAWGGDEATYEGDAQNGKPHGKGKLTFGPNDMRDYYVGDFVDGRMEGEGDLLYKNNNNYKGTFVGGIMHGHGTFTYRQSDGMVTTHQYPDYGFVLSRNARVYEGEWKNGKRDGQGKLTSLLTGRTIYDGAWQNDLPHGQGQAFFIDHTSYRGNWHYGKPHGNGVLLEFDGTPSYVGPFQDGKMHGHGRAFWDYPNGDRFEGEWVDGQQDGHGTMTYADGRVVTGIWRSFELVEETE